MLSYHWGSAPCLTYLLNVRLHESLALGLQCLCFLRQWSHMTEWAEPGCLEWLVNMCVAMEKEEGRQAAAEACREGGYVCVYNVCKIITPVQ